jgi:hypothetical protein
VVIVHVKVEERRGGKQALLLFQFGLLTAPVKLQLRLLAQADVQHSAPAGGIAEFQVGAGVVILEFPAEAVSVEGTDLQNVPVRHRGQPRRQKGGPHHPSHIHAAPLTFRTSRRFPVHLYPIASRSQGWGTALCVLGQVRPSDFM